MEEPDPGVVRTTGGSSAGRDPAVPVPVPVPVPEEGYGAPAPEGDHAPRVGAPSVGSVNDSPRQGEAGGGLSREVVSDASSGAAAGRDGVVVGRAGVSRCLSAAGGEVSAAGRNGSTEPGDAAGRDGTPAPEGDTGRAGSWRGRSGAPGTGRGGTAGRGGPGGVSEAVVGVGRRDVLVSGPVFRGASPVPAVAVGRWGGRGGTVPGRSGFARRGSVAEAGGVSGKRAEAGGGGGLTVSAAKGEKGRRPGKRGRVSEEPDADASAEPEPASVPTAEPAPASDPAPAPDPLRAPEPLFAKPSLSNLLSSDVPPGSGPLPWATARSASEPFPRSPVPASAPAPRRAARRALPPSHHPVPGRSPSQVALPSPSSRLPLPLPVDAAPGLPCTFDCPCASCVPDTDGIGPRSETALEAAPEDPRVPEYGPSKSPPVVSAVLPDTTRLSGSAESARLVESVAFTGCVELPEGACGEGGCGGTGARRDSVLMHPPFPRTRATVCFMCGPVCSCPCSYTRRRPPRLTRYAEKTKSSRARIPAAADRHPGRGRTTGGVSSVRARHSTGCPRSNGNQSTPPGLLPGTSHYPAVILSGRLRS